MNLKEYRIKKRSIAGLFGTLTQLETNDLLDEAINKIEEFENKVQELEGYITYLTGL